MCDGLTKPKARNQYDICRKLSNAFKAVSCAGIMMRRTGMDSGTWLVSYVTANVMVGRCAGRMRFIMLFGGFTKLQQGIGINAGLVWRNN